MKTIAYDLFFVFRIVDAAGDIEPLWSSTAYVVVMTALLIIPMVLFFQLVFVE